MIRLMPDRRRHRGPHPQDAELFAPARLPALREAVSDLSWLLQRGYAQPSAIKIVGDRYELTTRQRIAVQRASCTEVALAGRVERQIGVSRLGGREIAIDGYNVLVTIESALAGGLILGGRDGTYRDLASMHGSYRSMLETRPALELIARALADLGVLEASWALDTPVSNSGRLRTRMMEMAAQNQWHWEVHLCTNPDAELIADPRIVISSDSVILDGCAHWSNLARHLIQTHVPQAWVVDLA
jgi:hypothetical protein